MTSKEMQFGAHRYFSQSITVRHDIQYKAPKHVLRIVMKYYRNVCSNDSYKPARYLTNKSKKHYIFSKEQDQELINAAVSFVNLGMDMTKIFPYKKIVLSHSEFQYLPDPRILRNRLKRLCNEKRTRELEDICGYGKTADVEELKKIFRMAQKSRTSCLDVPQPIKSLRWFAAKEKEKKIVVNKPWYFSVSLHHPSIPLSVAII